MKILLINPPDEKSFALFTLDDYSKQARSYQTPLGLLYLQAYLNGVHDVQIIDMDAQEIKISSIQGIIDTVQPNIIGITTVIGKLLSVYALSKEIKAHSDIPIVCGGVHASLYTYEMLQNGNIDYIIQGFGQEPLSDLCDAIENDYNTEDIPDVFTKKNCNKKTKGSFWFRDVDKFPMPDRSILNINDYHMPFFGDANPSTSMVTSFGCPFKCFFCACKNFQPVILRKPENIIAEMKHIESIGIRSILFQDELFTMNTKRIKEISSAIIKNNINLAWSVRSRANLVNKEALEMMRDAGCQNIHLGIESGTDRILSKMNKKLTIDIIKRSVNTIKEAGLGVTASFMIGYHDETEDEIIKTIQFAKNIELNVSQFYLTQPEPHTELYQELKETKNLPDDIYSEFTLSGDETILKNNIASTLYSKEQLENYLRLAYSSVRSLYDIKKENS